MKRLFTLFVLMCMTVGLADVVGFASLSTAVAQKTPTTKIRYIYLWDVTGSIKPAGKDNKPVPDEGLYGRIYGYLRQDVESKPDGTEIVVVPFNDAALTPIKFKVADGKIVAQGGRQWGELAQYGCEEVYNHYEKWDDNKVKKDPEVGGFTDIAKSLDYVRRNYVDSNYNNIFILLTDGGQEYLADDKIGSKGPDARKHLQESIVNFDLAMREQSSTNRLFYVIIVPDEDSPHKHQNEMSLTNTSFIDVSKGSVNLHFCPITASLDVKGGVMSSRNKNFNIKLNTKEGYQLPSDITLSVNDYVGTQRVKVNNGVAKVDCDGRYDVEDDMNVELALTATLPNDGKVESGNDIYHYWFENMTLHLKVTNNFKPELYVTTYADCANWGATEYYSSVPWSEYKPVVMEQNITVRLNPDACKLFAGEGKVTFYVSASDDDFEQPEDIIMYYNGEKCEDYHFTVDLSAVTDKDTEYFADGVLGFEFTEDARLEDHTLYIGYNKNLGSCVNEYNKVVEVEKGVPHDVDIKKDLSITVDEELSNNGIVIIKTEKMNPLVKGLMWTLIVLVTLFVLSIILCRMMTPAIRVSYIALTGIYQKRVRVKGYNSVVFTSRKQKQSFIHKLYKGTILYEVHPSWVSNVEILPRDKKSVRIRFDGKDYACDNLTLAKNQHYTLSDLTNRTKIDINVL